MAKIDTKDLFNRARELREAKEEIMAEQIANREVLRNLRDSGMLTDDEIQSLEDIYPTRTRNRGDGGTEEDEA
jgi:hypothetical protein